jgi:hypothetical protein
MTGSACLLLILLLLRAVLTVDPYFDTFAYHLPFAARLSGICPESCYRMGEYLEAAYDGFPKLLHGLQGLVWRITGLAQAVDVLNVGALVLFCLFLRRWFQVPLAWAFCGLVAVPLIQIHATSTYIDLPSNLAVAAAILALPVLARAPETFGWRKLAIFMPPGLPQTANHSCGRCRLCPVRDNRVCCVASGRRVGPFIPGRRASWLGLLCLLVLAGAAMGAKLVENAIAHGNPFYPVRLALLGFVLNGTIDALGPDQASLAETWRSVPSPLRWLASVLEMGAYDYRQLPWTYDQGYCETALSWKDCWRPVSASFRMGGYFVPYVLSLVIFLGWRLASQLREDRRVLIATFVGTTLLACLLPRSHELRYYLFWMIVLVALGLIVVFDQCDSAIRAGAKASTLLGLIIIVALASVLSLTQGRYVTPIGPNVTTVIDTLGVKDRVAAISDGTVVCVDSGWQPFTFLFAPVLHPGRSYTILDGQIGPCDVVVPPRNQ